MWHLLPLCNSDPSGLAAQLPSLGVSGLLAFAVLVLWREHKKLRDRIDTESAEREKAGIAAAVAGAAAQTKLAASLDRLADRVTSCPVNAGIHPLQDEAPK